MKVKELFVSYDIALKLKELNFKEKCIMWFDHGVLYHLHSSDYTLFILKENNNFNLVAPLYQQVIDWLRNEHNIILYVYIPNETGYFAHSLENKAKYDTYYEALNNGIWESLDLIENKFV